MRPMITYVVHFVCVSYSYIESICLVLSPLSLSLSLSHTHTHTLTPSLPLSVTLSISPSSRRFLSPCSLPPCRYMCPHTNIYVASYYYIRRCCQECCVYSSMRTQHLYSCPHTTIYVSSYYYVRVLILLYTQVLPRVLRVYTPTIHLL
jgi:hypothetical protein